MKVDVSKIEGYESMSAEEKLKAIESYEFAEPDYSGYVTKDTFDKTASEYSVVLVLQYSNISLIKLSFKDTSNAAVSSGFILDFFIS